jgi:hypothetical protein
MIRSLPTGVGAHKAAPGQPTQARFTSACTEPLGRVERQLSLAVATGVPHVGPAYLAGWSPQSALDDRLRTSKQRIAPGHPFC